MGAITVFLNNFGVGEVAILTYSHMNLSFAASDQMVKSLRYTEWSR